jgi:hypothetical protein
VRFRVLLRQKVEDAQIAQKVAVGAAVGAAEYNQVTVTPGGRRVSTARQKRCTAADESTPTATHGTEGVDVAEMLKFGTLLVAHTTANDDDLVID